VFDNNLRISGSMSMTRADLTNLGRVTAETELEMHILLQETTGSPKACLAIYIPKLKLTNVSKQLGADGAMIETLPFMVGKKDAATGYDATMVTFSTSAA
jgi:hypothetical protein